MPTVPVPQVDQWSELTGFSVVLGLFCILILVGIPWAVWTHRKDILKCDADRAEDRREHLATIDKQSQYIDTASARIEAIIATFQQHIERKDTECAAERRHIEQQFELRLREVVQSKIGARRG